jgi:molybdopterin-guanine dinucleotide biosynthesis protein A
MGRNKAFLRWKGRTFLWLIIGALSPLFRELLLVTREPERYAGLPVRIVEDLYPERGPLTGVLSGLLMSSDRLNFCVACDMPMIRPALVQFMMHVAEGYDAVVPLVSKGSGERGGVPQPLHAVYDKRCLPVMERHLREGRRGMQGVIRSLNVRFFSEKEAGRIDPDLRSYVSINTQQEYRALDDRTF